MKKIIAVEEKLVIRYVGITSAQNQYIDLSSSEILHNSVKSK